MKKQSILFIIFSILLCCSWQKVEQNWFAEKHNGYTLMYTTVDKNNTKEYHELIANGMKHVNGFFRSPYKKAFRVFVHPDRQSLDSTWQKDWKMPAFKSECWMVASGVATKLDMISPKRWDEQSCEHRYAEKSQTQQLITHELVHVYHGQLNVSPDFNNTEGIDWFVEGLATFISGQCDSVRMAVVKNAIVEDKIPRSLDEFWTGKIKYGLSGSVVMYINHVYGRKTLIKLLPLNKKTELLNVLKTTESALLAGWKKYMQQL